MPRAADGRLTLVFRFPRFVCFQSAVDFRRFVRFVRFDSFDWK